MFRLKIQNILTSPESEIIIHQVNCQGVMGSGVAKAIRERYSFVYDQYKLLCECNTPEELLGKPQFCTNYTDKRCVINLFGQLDYKRFNQPQKLYTNYNAFSKALSLIECGLPTTVGRSIKDISLAIPWNIGSDRDGADFNKIYNLINKYLGEFDVTFYSINNILTDINHYEGLVYCEDGDN